jgi:hypothetical protein
MTLVSPTQISPSDEITAASVNTPVNQLANTINGNLDDANISGISGTKVASGTLPASAATTDANVETRLSEIFGDFVASGAVWSISSGLAGTMTSGVVYIGGRRVVVSAITTRNFTASKDTYVSVNNAGVVSYSEVANGAAAPALPADSVWLAIVVTDGTGITAVKLFGSGLSGTVIYPTTGLGPWRSYTPAWTNSGTANTIGNGSLTGAFNQVGKTVYYRIRLTLGTTTGAGNGSWIFSLPVLTHASAYAAYSKIGNTTVFDTSGSASYTGPARWNSTGTITAVMVGTGGTYGNYADVNSATNIPMVWTSTDIIEISGWYETP